METRYLFRLVLSNGVRKMIASPVKTRSDAWRQASDLKKIWKATNVEIWSAYNLELIMEIKIKK